ncbi:retrovirus-related pol polyprotein from transposon TNT 1-94 [Tanacetum coccineum]
MVASLFNKFKEDKVRVMLGIVQTTMLQAKELTGMRERIQQVKLGNFAWFKEKVMLVEAHEAGQILDEEQSAFLADPGTDGLDAFDSDCDEAPGASAVFMAHISSYESDVISEVHNSDNYQDNNVLNMCVPVESYFKQSTSLFDQDMEITSDSNIISYEQYLQETASASVQNNISTDEQITMIMSIFDALSVQVAKCTADSLKHKDLDASLTVELKSYKERVKQLEDRQNVDLNNREKMIEKQINDMILHKNAKFSDFQQEIDTLKSNLSKHEKENECLLSKIDALKKETKEKEEKYFNKEIDLEKLINDLKNISYKMGQSMQTMHMLTKPQSFYDDAHKQALEETLSLAEESREKMLEKQNDPISKDKKVNISPINYAKLNKLFEYFGKHFIPQKELSAEQAFWLWLSNPISKQPVVQSTPVRTEAPKELPEVSLVKITFQKLKNHLASFDKVVKVRTTPDVITKGAWGLHLEITKVKTIFNQMEVAVEQCSVDKKYVETQMKELHFENDLLLEHIICQDVVNIILHADVKFDNVLPMQNNFLDDNIALNMLKIKNDRLIKLLISQDLVYTIVNSLANINDFESMQQSYVDEYTENLMLKAKLVKKNDMLENLSSNNQSAPKFWEFFIINNLKAQLEAKDVLIEKLKKHIATLKGKSAVESAKSNNVIPSKMYKLDLPLLSPRLKNNREAHVDYHKVTQEHTHTIYDLVKHARASHHVDSKLHYACQYVQRIQELSVYVCATFPSTKHVNTKVVVVIPLNTTRKVKFAKPCDTPKTTTQQQVKPTQTQTINNSMFNSIGVSSSTEACGSQTKSNTRNNRISQSSSSNTKKNKLEDHHRIVKSSLDKKNRVSTSVYNESVKQSVLNANSELNSVTYKKCTFDVVHDSCVVSFINDVSVNGKSKSVKAKSGRRKKKEWKPCGKVFSSIGHRWLPTGRNFTLAGNVCLLTRITPTNVVPPRENVPSTPNTKTPSAKFKVFHRSTKVAKAVSFNNTPSIVIQIVLWYLDSGCSKHMIGQHSQLINFVSKCFSTVRFRNDQIAKIIDDGDLISGSKGTNLYTISLDDMLKSSLICLLSKASKTKSWLWHRRLSHLNFSTLNQLAKQGLARGIPKLKFKKDHLCLACSLGKNLCRPMRVESINGKKYILVIVDDYS